MIFNDFISISRFYKKRTEKLINRPICAFLSVSVVFFACSLVTAYFGSDIYYFTAVAVSSLAWLTAQLLAMDAEGTYSAVLSFFSTETGMYVFQILIYILTILLSAIPAVIINKRSKPYEFAEKAVMPKKALLYIPTAFALIFIANFAVNALFGDILGGIGEVAEPELPKTVLPLILSFISVTVVPAFLEEWLFRGILVKSLLPYGKIFAIIAPALLFGLLHVSPLAVLSACVFGVIAGYTFYITGSIRLGVLIHFLNNAYAFAASYAVIDDNGVFNAAAICVELVFLLLLSVGIVGIFIYAFTFKKSGISVKTKNAPSELARVGFWTSVKKLICNPILYVLCGLYIFYLITTLQ